MLVYGDHKFAGQLQALRARLVALAHQARADQQNLEHLRALLIFCGQVEQGAHDTLAQLLPPDKADPLIRLFHRATAHAAEAFYSLAHQQPMALPAPVIDTATALRDLLTTLDTLHTAPDLTLTIKVPEGFSIYALYPEQYLIAAAHWLAEHAQPQAQGAVVVGIRTIGTTLAAVVSTVLRAAGWPVQSLTVRPTGHPYERQVAISGQPIQPTAFGLIVDEGPGISGSSMAATADALVQAGLDRHTIAFLPGHPHDPGGAGGEAVQRWWQTTPRYVAGTQQLTFNGLPLQDALAATLPEVVIQIEDFSGGQWRHALYADAGEWPALCTAFERIKYRYTLHSGRQVLFKFLGLASNSPALTSAAEAAAAILRERAEQGFAAPVLGVAYGFVATEWLEGRPIEAGALSPELIDTIGRYIAQVAGLSLREDEAQTALEALKEMLFVNTREALGEEAAKLAQRCGVVATACQRAYGDGHLHPYEWIETLDHQLFKTDSIGHDCDHTLIGRQAVAWDLAGAMVEWRLDAKAVERLLMAFCASGGTPLDADTLAFYRAAYLAFRVGQCSLAAQVHDPHERERLLQAGASYRQALAKLLGVELTAALQD
jgi:hypothetical protein